MAPSYPIKTASFKKFLRDLSDSWSCIIFCFTSGCLCLFLMEAGIKCSYPGGQGMSRKCSWLILSLTFDFICSSSTALAKCDVSGMSAAPKASTFLLVLSRAQLLIFCVSVCTLAAPTVIPGANAVVDGTSFFFYRSLSPAVGQALYKMLIICCFWSGVSSVYNFAQISCLPKTAAYVAWPEFEPVS